MNNKTVIALSILGLDDKVNFIKKALKKNLNHIHYDVMDGHFVANKSLPIQELDFIFKHTPPHIKDLHLMVMDPLWWINHLKNQVDYFTFHYEAESIDNMHEIFRNYGHLGKIGLAIKPQTNLSAIIEFLPEVSHILVMSVEPGQGGQTFIPATLAKIKALKSLLAKYNPRAFIQVDGGINDQTAAATRAAGANNLVVGSYGQKNLTKPNFIKSLMP